MKGYAKVEIDAASFRKAEGFLEKLPLEVRIVVVEKSVRAAAAPVVKRAQQLAPDSHKTGTWDKWSQRTLAKRGGARQHKDTIGTSSVRNYSGGLTAIYVGPLHPAGNLINIIGHPHAQVLWGRRTSNIIPPVKYLHEAAEQTKGQQQAAFVSSAERQSKRILVRK